MACISCTLSVCIKGHSHSPCPQKNVYNFSLESPRIFLPVPFSYNYPSRSFFMYVKFQSITSLLSYSISMY